MSLVKLTIKGISYSQTQNGAYALILNEADGDRKLPIVIGAFEAQSIAIALEKEIRPPRPLTHDLFKNFACFQEPDCPGTGWGDGPSLDHELGQQHLAANVPVLQGMLNFSVRNCPER